MSPPIGFTGSGDDPSDSGDDDREGKGREDKDREDRGREDKGREGQRGDEGSGPNVDPFSALFSSLPGLGAGGFDLSKLAGGGFDPSQLDPAALGAVLAQVQQLMTSSGDGPVNWELARDTARKAAAEGGDPSPGQADERAVAEALRVADLWLDRVCELPATGGRTLAWSRADWVEQTLPTWRAAVEPVAESVGTAMGSAMADQAPPELRPMIAAAGAMMRQIGGGLFGMQLGQALGGLARDVVSASDIGLPLAPAGAAALLPANVRAFGDGLGVDGDQVRLFLALREAAHTRLFAHVPWLRAHLLDAVAAYARGIQIDPSKIEEAVRSVDPTDPGALQEALGSGLFEPTTTPAQQAALERLETALALVEGWVDTVVDDAAGTSLPQASALRETIRRRRASGGPAEQAFATLVGLELRPRRLREAAAVWRRLGEERGQAARDALWQHPDLLPSAADLEHPEEFLARDAVASSGAGDSGSDLDEELRKMLDGDGLGEAGSGGSGGSGPGGSGPG